MATSPSLPTYGIACSHNTSSLLKEICTFTQLPLGDWFPFISPWHKWWTTLHLAAWNHTASFSHIPRFPWEEQWLQPGGGHLPGPRGDHPAVLGLMLLQSSSRWTVSESTSLCCYRVPSETLLLLHQHKDRGAPQLLLAVSQWTWHWWEENFPSQYFFNKIKQVKKLIN